MEQVSKCEDKTMCREREHSYWTRLWAMGGNLIDENALTVVWVWAVSLRYHPSCALGDTLLTGFPVSKCNEDERTVEVFGLGLK